jgi:hypothetical protein
VARTSGYAGRTTSDGHTQPPELPSPRKDTLIASDLDASDLGRSVLDARGERIGELVGIYADTDSDVATFAGVKVAGFGRRRVVLVSLAGATIEHASLNVICGKKLATAAPTTRDGDIPSGEDAAALYAHYDIASPEDGTALRMLAPR